MQRADAFTLIETMVAVMILGLVVAFLASTSAQWSRMEGDARRRSEASLLADRLLADVEESAARGAVPPLGRKQQDEQMFRGTIETVAADPAALGLGAAIDPKQARQPETPGGLFGSKAAEATPPLLIVSIRVAWGEPTSEQAVTRTTFLLSPTALAALAGEPSAAESPK